MFNNSNSVSSKRMQADVERNVNQQQRIVNGVKDGSLTNHEVGKLEHGQAKADRKEYRVARDGHIDGHQQRRIQRSENHQSRRIHHEKHDRQSAG